MSPTSSLRLGTRGSQLAMWQARHVARLLADAGVETEIVTISTIGDRDRRVPLAQLGGTGVFTKEIQAALQAGKVDCAVHSLKDLPTLPVEGLTLVAVPEREVPFDAWLAREGQSWKELPAGSRVATGSVRRASQLLHARPDLEVVPVRGNVETRLTKLQQGDFEAMILAAAGLIRLELAEHIVETLRPPQMLPAPGQGALGLECRVDDQDSIMAIAKLNHGVSRAAVDAERALLARLEAGCSAPLGAHGTVEENQLHLQAVVLSPTGRERICDSLVGTVEAPQSLGEELGEKLLSRGAAKLVENT